MKLSHLLKAINADFYGEDAEIEFITDDSRKCKAATLFVCHDGAKEFIKEAEKNGAVYVLSKSEAVSDTRKAYASLCKTLFAKPDEKLKMVAVTGTNGKTSVSSALCFMLELNGKKAGLIGTVLNKFGEEKSSEMTTPDPFELYSMLSKMAENGFEYCVIEASSQGLCQERLYGITFETAVFTNLTEDHLDYHKSFENYKNAKLMLFENCKTAIINYDDKYKDEFIKRCSGNVVTYSTKSDEASFTAKNIRYFPESTSYELVSDCIIHRITLHTQGDFWVANSLAAIVCAIQNGLTAAQCAFSLRNFSGVKGRMELLQTNTDFRVIIDYAHTADGLKNALVSLKRFCGGRLIVVFGCGGDREKEKRSLMGEIAVKNSDMVFVTSDNPRTEDPQKIIDDILVGIKKARTPVYIIENRKEAIRQALKKARKGDTVLIAGKGHEEYQIIGKEKVPFDETQIVKNFIRLQSDKN